MSNIKFTFEETGHGTYMFSRRKDGEVHSISINPVDLSNIFDKIAAELIPPGQYTTVKGIEIKPNGTTLHEIIEQANANGLTGQDHANFVAEKFWENGVEETIVGHLPRT